MKTALLLALALSVTAPASRAEEGDFETHKTEILKHLDEHIAKLQEHRGCISGASSKEALMKCRESMKDYRFEKKMELMEKRKEHMDKRMKKARENHDAKKGGEQPSSN
jgi:hypothetical protein